jgi:CBS domain-containing protein
MNVKDIMTTEVVTVTSDTPFKEVVEQLVRSGISCVPVVDEHELVGIVTEADLISKEAYGARRRRALALLADIASAREHGWATKATGSLAADVMTRNVIVSSPRDDVRVAARRMLERRVKRLPVVEEGELVGIVSRQDVLRMFDRSDEAITADLDRVLSSALNMPDDHHVSFSVDDGIVTLTGDVRYAWDKPVVVSLARDVEGVIDVISRLHNREPNPRTTPTPWIGVPRG